MQIVFLISPGGPERQTQPGFQRKSFYLEELRADIK